MSDRSHVRTIATTYADQSLAAKTVITTSADGLTTTTRQDLDGNGQDDQVVTTIMQLDGATTTTRASLLADHTTTTTSADGLQTDIVNDDYDLDTQITQLGDGYGSYNITMASTDWYWYTGGPIFKYTGDIGLSETHLLNADGVDEITTSSGRGGSTVVHKSVAQEIQDRAAAVRAYDTVLDRDPSAVEISLDASIASTTTLVNNLVTGAEFGNKYGALTNIEFVERIDANALDRGADIDELAGWLRQMSNGTTWAAIAVTVSESAEHLAVGNNHAISNNTNADGHAITAFSTSEYNNYAPDHTLDRAVAGNEVSRLYQTVLGRNPDPSSLATTAASITGGASTDPSIVQSLISSSEFSSRYGSETDLQFVSQMFSNGLHRSATTDESSFWSQALGNGSVSRADFAVAVADSGRDVTGLNQMIQAMATMTPAGAGTSPLELTAISPQERTLASAHA